MRVFLEIAGDRYAAKVPFDGASYVEVDIRCPMCAEEGPIRVQGLGISERTHDEYRATALHLECDRPIGRLIAQVSTIFGIEEDERVLNGRPRVY